MESRLKEIANRHHEVENLMSQPETASNPNAIRRLGREYSQLQHIVDLWNQMTRAQSDLEGAENIVAEEEDPEVRQWANEEIQELQQKLETLTEDIKLELLPKTKQNMQTPLSKYEQELVEMRPVYLHQKFSVCTRGTLKTANGSSRY